MFDTGFVDLLIFGVAGLIGLGAIGLLVVLPLRDKSIANQAEAEAEAERDSARRQQRSNEKSA
jgi:hypothetical protein